jgi:hypothetical protein
MECRKEFWLLKTAGLFKKMQDANSDVKYFSCFDALKVWHFLQGGYTENGRILRDGYERWDLN